MRSIQFGAYDNMLKNIVESYTGYLQIQHPNFVDEKTIDNSFSYSAIEELKLRSNLPFVNPRIEGFALASNKDISKPVALLCVDAKKEKNYIKLNKKVIAGSYFDQQKGVLVAKNLKEILQINIGDSLVLLSQGYQGSIANGVYPVVGVVDLTSPDLNKRTLLMNLDLAQQFFGVADGITSAVVGVKKNKWEKTQQKLAPLVKEQQLALLSWKQMVPELNQLITIDRAGGTFVLFILYSIITFGLLGTVVMLTEERRFEYGVLVSVGMSKLKLIQVALLETVLMAISGVLLGLVVAFPVVLYFNIFPIDLSGQIQEVVEQFGFEALIPTSLDIRIALSQAAIVLGIILLVNTYAIWRIKTLQPIKAMRR
jgi:putative ABC transport system permease protein